MGRPNILLLHTDQQRFDTVAALGWNHVLTPSIDRLVARGVSFTRAYSSNPVCMPARHDLITGVSARHHGYWNNTGDPIKDYGLATLPRLLTWAGYQTIAVGKMHFHPEREHHGFSHMFLMEELPTCRENDAYLQYLEQAGFGHIRCQHGVRPLVYHTPQKARVPEEHHGSAWVAHKTIECIRAERNRPFFIFASWVGPHPPYYVPPRYLEMYRDRTLPAPCPRPEAAVRHAPPSPENAGGLRLQRLREAYFAATTLIDTHIGRILDALEQTGQLDNTLILFTSDHGEMLGDRGVYQKQVPNEGAARIPLIACGPGFAHGRCDVPVTTWDTAATILAAADVTPPKGHPMVGASLQGIGASGGDRIVVVHNGHGRGRYVSAIDGARKFIHWYGGGDEELYDLEADPWEQTNLLARAAADVGALAEPLRRACIRFEQEHGEAACVRDGAFVDQRHVAPHPHECSLYPLWSSHQFPRWMTGYAKEDLAAIAAEMRDGLDEPTAYICREPAWRQDAVKRWGEIGGDPAVYEALFKTVGSAGEARPSRPGRVKP